VGFVGGHHHVMHIRDGEGFHPLVMPLLRCSS
jgi:hypothetical protein